MPPGSSRKKNNLTTFTFTTLVQNSFGVRRRLAAARTRSRSLRADCRLNNNSKNDSIEDRNYSDYCYNYCENNYQQQKQKGYSGHAEAGIRCRNKNKICVDVKKAGGGFAIGYYLRLQRAQAYKHSLLINCKSTTEWSSVDQKIQANTNRISK